MIVQIRVNYNVKPMLEQVDTTALTPPIPPASDNIALSYEAAVPLGKFTIEQLKSWLQKLFNQFEKTNPTFKEKGMDGFQELLLAAVLESSKKAMEKENALAKTKQQGGIFGGSTISNRSRYYNTQKKDKTIDQHVGKFIIAMNLNHVLKTQLQSSNTSSEVSFVSASAESNNSPLSKFTAEEISLVIEYLKTAIEQRSHADTQYRIQLEEYYKQQHRLNVENSNAIPSRKRMIEEITHGSESKKSKPNDEAASTVSSAAGDNATNEFMLVDDVNLEDLFGGTIATVASSAPSVTAKDEPKPVVKKEPVATSQPPVVKQELTPAVKSEVKATVRRPRVVIK